MDIDDDFDISEADFVRCLLFVCSPRGTELSEEALEQILSQNGRCQEDFFDIRGLIKRANAKLPNRNRIILRRGHRQNYVKISAKVRQKLFKLLPDS